MEQTEIKAVDLVRQIRDQHYAQLQNKSREELKGFFRREAAAAQEEAERLLRHKHSTPAGRT
jgi:hypothetical protein